MSAPSVKLVWTQTTEWDIVLGPVEWARLVEEMDNALPTDQSAASVATVKQFMRANSQLCEEVLSSLEIRRPSCCITADYSLDRAVFTP